MIADVLIPLLQKRFPGQGVVGEINSNPCMTYPAKHPEVGEVQIHDHGDEITLYAGKFTHGHFSNYDDISESEKEKAIAEDVADFLELLFSDQVVLWGSHQGIGGWKMKTVKTDSGRFFKHYVWSGPI